MSERKPFRIRFVDHKALLGGANSEDARLRRIDDGGKEGDTIHAEIRYRKRASLNTQCGFTIFLSRSGLHRGEGLSA